MKPDKKYLPSVKLWITATAALVILMVLIGGLTRLTESGLSIVEWKLISGVFPPTTDEEWEVEFSAYKTSPEYLQVNRGFDLNDFKRIYWLEYLHRVLGRIIGFALMLPFFYFISKRALPPPLVNRMGLAIVLVAAQGIVGWIMVRSGLTDEARVDPIKLALHLSLALALLSLLLWTRWEISETRPRKIPARGTMLLRVLLGVVTVQVIMGALVAGLDAGLSYNTFPLMDGTLIPPDLHLLSPWWVNHVENICTVQFQHRVGGYAVVVLAIAALAHGWNSAMPEQRRWLKLLAWTVALQFSLGVITLVSVVDIRLASLHQLGAVLLLGITLRLVWLYPSTKRPN